MSAVRVETVVPDTCAVADSDSSMKTADMTTTRIPCGLSRRSSDRL